MTQPITAPPKVFVSYSHDSAEHAERVLEFSDRLRRDGIDCVLDQYVAAPVEGWPRWMDSEIRGAHFVLMVCTPTYYRRVIGEEQSGKGQGVRWEGNLIYQHVYNADTANKKFIPILFDDGMASSIPDPLRGLKFYLPQTNFGYEELYRRLTNQPLTPAGELGQLRILPPKDRKWRESLSRGESGLADQAPEPMKLGDIQEDKSSVLWSRNDRAYDLGRDIWPSSLLGLSQPKMWAEEQTEILKR